MKRKILLSIIISIIIFSTSASYAQKVSKRTVKDFDGNIYYAVTIGKQVWIVENLKVTHYRNGDPILHAPDDMQWYNAVVGSTENKSGAYCCYNNDESYRNIYGYLYNSHVVTDSRGICPTGWHVPTKEEWKTLETYLGGDKVAGGKIKEAGTTHWISPNAGADNSSGFTGLPGGERFTGGLFASMGFTSYFWSSDWKSLDGIDAPWFRLVYFSPISIFHSDYTEAAGFSIRCIKDKQ